jgi:glycine/D-amino acid oxidase-like deaminating enzyme
LLKVDIAVVGAGLAGLATALALYQRKPGSKVAVLSPGVTSPLANYGFGSNQPAIASHPHFSKDHNILSQWTSFCMPENDRLLSTTFEINPAIAVARGRWQIAQSTSHAIDVQIQMAVFNTHMSSKFHAHWHADVGSFGALWLPNAWAISPVQLQLTWMQLLKDQHCLFFDGYVTRLKSENTNSENTITIDYLEDGVMRSISAEKAVLCSPSSLHGLLDSNELQLPNLLNLPLEKCLPLVQWPGQSQVELSPERSTLFGITTVQSDSYAIALGDNQWLVRDEQETATVAFRGDRWHAPDRLPYLGSMFDIKAIASNALDFVKNDQLNLPTLANVVINSAHGTRGLLSGIAGASVAADMLLGANTSLSQTLSSALNPNRYIRRGLRQHFAHLQSNTGNL